MIPNMFHFKQSLRISPSVKETASDDGAVLLDVEQGICFSLNSSGLRIWNLLKQGNSVDRIADILESDYAVPRSQLVSDLNSLIFELESRKLLFADGQINDRDKASGIWSRLWKRRNSG